MRIRLACFGLLLALAVPEVARAESGFLNIHLEPGLALSAGGYLKDVYGDQSSAFGFHGAEVEVDEETGEIRLLRLVAAHDIGRAINPKGVEGQIEGGVAQGLGFALMETLFADDGHTVLSNLQDYKIPAALDVPEAIETVLVEMPDPEGPYGAKGVAEPATIPVAAAIVNAIANAVGVRIRDLPATPEKIVEGLAEAGAGP